MYTSQIVAVIFIVAVIYTSHFELLLHRYLMHKPFLGFRYAYLAHALVHHRIFGYKQDYHLQRPADRKTIPMAWWNGPVLIAIATILPFFVSWLVGIWWLWIEVLVVVAMYYGAYEYIHWCMHNPLRKKRMVEKSPIFYRLNGHHLLHHRYMGKNFNVVCPIADLFCGTLILRSKIRFDQPMSDRVPDVQPRTKKVGHFPRVWFEAP